MSATDRALTRADIGARFAEAFNAHVPELLARLPRTPGAEFVGFVDLDGVLDAKVGGVPPSERAELPDVGPAHLCQASGFRALFREHPDVLGWLDAHAAEPGLRVVAVGFGGMWSARVVPTPAIRGTAAS